MCFVRNTAYGCTGRGCAICEWGGDAMPNSKSNRTKVLGEVDIRAIIMIMMCI